MNKKPRLLILDDHEMFRKGTKKLFEQSNWVGACEDCGSLAEGLKLLTEFEPDIILLDLYMGKDVSVYSIPKIRELAKNAKIIILTVSEEPEDLISAAKFKADGYLVKSTPYSKIEKYIQSIYEGQEQVCISESLANTLYQALISKEKKILLTPQEQVVLQYVNEGYTNKEIADKLFISVYTVKNHVSNIMRKMNVSRRYQLMSKEKDL